MHIRGLDQAAHSTRMTELAPLKMKMSQSVEGKANKEVLFHMCLEPRRELENKIMPIYHLLCTQIHF